MLSFSNAAGAAAIPGRRAGSFRPPPKGTVTGMGRWVGSAVVAVLLVWLLGAATLLSVPSADRFSGPQARFVPASGDAARLLVGGGPGTAASAEHALFQGLTIAVEMPRPVIQAIRPPQDQAGNSGLWWREILSPNTPELAPQLTLRGVTPAGITLYARSGTGGAAFRPAVLELPGEVAAGAAWESAGEVQDSDGVAAYRNTGRARAADTPALAERGCLVVDSTTTIRDIERTDTATWCPGAGIVTGTPTLGEPRRELPEQRWPGARRASTTPTWPRGESIRAARFTEGDPSLGVTPSEPSFHRRLGARVTTGGTLVGVSSTGTLQGWLRRGDQLTGVWWAHPGGTILSLTVLDNIVLVTTSEKRLVAYDQNGRRLWSNRTPDLVPGGVIGIGRDQLAAATLTGDLLAFDLATGSRRWRAEFQAGTDLAPVLLGDLLVVRGKDKLLHGFGTDGARRFVSEELDSELVGVVRRGDTLFGVSGSGEGYFLNAGTGVLERTQVVAFGKSHQELVPGPGESAALLSADGVRLIDPGTGRELAVVPQGSRVLATAEDWWVVGPAELVRLDPAGAVLDRRPLNPGVPDARTLAAVGDTAWIVGAKEAVWVR